MLIKLESDLHIDKDFNQGYKPNLSNVDVYCIAGDLGQWKVCVPFINNLIKEYPDVHIVHVCGNHEYYDTYIEKPEKIFSELSLVNDKYHYLQNSSVVINGLRFIGSTLWTSLNNKNPLDVNDALNAMNDYRLIRFKNGVLKFLPQNSIRLHEIAKEYIFKTLEESEEDTVVITHHKPFSTNNNYLSSAFEVELRGDLIESRKPPIMWFSGHDHKHHDMVFKCNDKDIRFISNPLGYPHEKNTSGYKENLKIEI
jgi:predicted phosphohydrolase